MAKSKNGEKRTIPLNKKTFDLLKAKTKARNISSDYVFGSEIDTKIHRRNLLRAFYAARKRAGIENFTFHDLRHTCATLLLAQAVPLRVIMEILGHSQIATTANVYSHVLPVLMADAAQRVDAVLAAS